MMEHSVYLECALFELLFLFYADLKKIIDYGISIEFIYQ